MKTISKAVSFFLTVFLAAAALTVFSAAADADIYQNRGGIVCVSHRGDSALYPKNSLQAVQSAFEKGAHAVSISVQKTADGAFVLLENAQLSAVCKTDKTSARELTEEEICSLKLYNTDKTVSDYTPQPLASALSLVTDGKILIIDNAWEYRDELAAFCERSGADKNIILRTDESAKKIASWLDETGGKLPVIGIYDGAIIFSAWSHLSTLSKAGMPCVQFQSKNYFNVFYGKFTAKRYSQGENARALATVYSKDLCGQREDSINGWDELIRLGFSVIETNNIEGLVNYVAQCDSVRQQLAQAVKNSGNIDASLYTQGSAQSFESACTAAAQCLENQNASLGELEQSHSELLQSMKDLSLKTHSDTQKGTLHITAGKSAAVVIFGLLILAGEIYLYKMQMPGRKRQKH